jgi:hypothetical protein
MIVYYKVLNMHMNDFVYYMTTISYDAISCQARICKINFS